MTELFRVDGLRARPETEHSTTTGDDEILSGLDLTVGAGELHAIVGTDDSPTGAIGPILLGSARYEVTAGSIHFQGDDITAWPVEERARVGIFLGLPLPHDIAGVSVLDVLQRAASSRADIDLSASELRLAVTSWATRLGIDPASVDPADRHRLDILQIAILRPDLAILDVHDTSLDNDAIGELRSARPGMGLVLVTDDPQALGEIHPDHVHVLDGGRLRRSATTATTAVPA